MASIIVLSGVEAASNADVLANTRLQTVPKGGVLTFQLQASDSDATNNFVATIALPSGDTPLDGVRIPCGRVLGLTGNLNESDETKISFPVGQGGHTVFSVTETGDAELTWRVTYSPL